MWWRLGPKQLLGSLKPQFGCVFEKSCEWDVIESRLCLLTGVWTVHLVVAVMQISGSQFRVTALIRADLTLECFHDSHYELHKYGHSVAVFKNTFPSPLILIQICCIMHSLNKSN